MYQKIHTFSLELTLKVINEISKVDQLNAYLFQIKKSEGQTLKQLIKCKVLNLNEYPI